MYAFTSKVSHLYFHMKKKKKLYSIQKVIDLTCTHFYTNIHTSKCGQWFVFNHVKSIYTIPYKICKYSFFVVYVSTFVNVHAVVDLYVFEGPMEDWI